MQASRATSHGNAFFQRTEESSTRRIMSRVSTFAPTLNVSLTRSLKPANRARDRDLTALSAKPHPSLSHFPPRLDGTSATTWTRSVQTLPAPSLGCPGTGYKESREGRSWGPCGSAVAPCRAPSESSQPAPSGPEGRAMTYDSTKPPHCLGVELLVGNRNLPKQGIGKPTPLHCLRPAPSALMLRFTMSGRVETRRRYCCLVCETAVYFGNGLLQSLPVNAKVPSASRLEIHWQIAAHKVSVLRAAP